LQKGGVQFMTRFEWPASAQRSVEASDERFVGSLSGPTEVDLRVVMVVLTDTMVAKLCDCRQDLLGVYRSERKGGS